VAGRVSGCSWLSPPCEVILGCQDVEVMLSYPAVHLSWFKPVLSLDCVVGDDPVDGCQLDGHLRYPEQLACQGGVDEPDECPVVVSSPSPYLRSKKGPRESPSVIAP
jgi:hypothetical protein